jgi:hypothetical protein
MSSTNVRRLGAYLAMLSFFACLVGTSPVMGALIVQETFSHPDGALEGQVPEIGGTWASHSGNLTNDVQVVSGQARLNQPGGGEDIHTDFSTGAIGLGDVLYAAFDLTVPTQTPAVTSTYFAHFKDNANFFGARVWIAPPTAGGSYRLALSNDSSITDNDGEVFWGSDLAFGTTYRVVTHYEYDTGATKLWVNPVSESSTSVAATDGFANDAFTNYSFRQNTTSTVQLIDNLCVADQFGQALHCVPEPNSLAWMLVAGLAVVGSRRRAVR